MSDQAVIVERDVPPAGTWCESCKSKGHFCRASEYDVDYLPVCASCAKGEECETAKVVAGLDGPTTEWIEADVMPIAPVRSVDPATVTVVPAPDDPEEVRKSPADEAAERALARKLMKSVEDRRNGVKPREQRRPPKVIMPAHAVMGAEMIDPDQRNRVEKVKEEKLVKEAKKVVCRHPDCNEFCRGGRYGVCGKHWWWGARGEGRLDGGGVPKRDANGAAKTVAKRKGGRPKKLLARPAIAPTLRGDLAEMATITVPNAALDRFWNALTWAEKAEIVARQIAGA